MEYSAPPGQRRSLVLLFAMAWLLMAGVMAFAAPWLPIDDPQSQSSIIRLQAPSWHHWLGTDDLGRDVLSRWIWGARFSLGIGLSAVLLATAAGVPLGLFAGYWGGWIDAAGSMVVEVLMVFPSIVLALVLAAILGPSVESVILAVGIAQIPQMARQTRAAVRSACEQEYFLAGRVIGCRSRDLIRRYLLPNIVSPVLVLATMGMGGAVLDAAGLSFLGLTGDPNRPEWGSMLTANRDRFWEQPWLVIAPGVAITATVLSLNLLGDAVRDRLDPRTASHR